MLPIVSIEIAYHAASGGTDAYTKGVPCRHSFHFMLFYFIKYTSAYWLSPSGKSINGVGIEPDVIVDQSKEGDTQLDKAIETLK